MTRYYKVKSKTNLNGGIYRFQFNGEDKPEFHLLNEALEKWEPLVILSTEVSDDGYSYIHKLQSSLEQPNLIVELRSPTKNTGTSDLGLSFKEGLRSNELFLTPYEPDKLLKNHLDSLPVQRATVTENRRKNSGNATKTTPINLDSLPQTPSIVAVIQEIKRLEKNAKSSFGIRNQWKADEIKTALCRAIKSGVTDVTEDTGVRNALALHRIFGFFGAKQADALTHFDEATRNTPSHS